MRQDEPTQRCQCCRRLFPEKTLIKKLFGELWCTYCNLKTESPLDVELEQRRRVLREHGNS